MYFENPEDVLYHFLRVRVTDVKSRQTTDSETFTGDGAETEFTLADQPSCITSVTVDGTTQIPYTHYNINLDTKSIKFRTAPGDGLDIVVNYKEGTNWIFPDNPFNSLSASSYPRIGLIQINEPSEHEELGDQSNSYDFPTFQIDVVAYKDTSITINSETISGPDVVLYLSKQIENAFKDHTKTDLIYTVFAFEKLDNRPVPFAEGMNTYRRILTYRFSMRNLRRMVT